MSHNKKQKKTLDREEYGYGYDFSVDDLDVVGENDAHKKHEKKHQDKKNNSSLSHQGK